MEKARLRRELGEGEEYEKAVEQLYAKHTKKSQ